MRFVIRAVNKIYRFSVLIDLILLVCSQLVGAAQNHEISFEQDDGNRCLDVKTSFCLRCKDDTAWAAFGFCSVAFHS